MTKLSDVTWGVFVAMALASTAAAQPSGPKAKDASASPRQVTVATYGFDSARSEKAESKAGKPAQPRAAAAAERRRTTPAVAALMTRPDGSIAPRNP